MYMTPFLNALDNLLRVTLATYGVKPEGFLIDSKLKGPYEAEFRQTTDEDIVKVEGVYKFKGIPIFFSEDAGHNAINILYFNLRESCYLMLKDKGKVFTEEPSK